MCELLSGAVHRPLGFATYSLSAALTDSTATEVIAAPDELQEEQHDISSLDAIQLPGLFCDSSAFLQDVQSEVAPRYRKAPARFVFADGSLRDVNWTFKDIDKEMSQNERSCS